MRSQSWVIVVAELLRTGGMQRANYELARWLADQGARVHLVAHRIQGDLLAHDHVVPHVVPFVGGDFVSGRLLRSVGRLIAQRCVATEGSRVVVNGGNCHVLDATWVHAVHHAWPVRDEGAPLLRRLKNQVTKRISTRDEAAVVPAARVIIANSRKTRDDLLAVNGVDAARVHIVYLGCDPEIDRPASKDVIAAQRNKLGVERDELLVLFVGALMYDRNKGLDTLLDAWVKLRTAGGPKARLLAFGTASPDWQDEIARRGLKGEVELVGYRKDVGDVLAAADLLVAPSRYDSYGLAVQEAFCRDVPVILSSAVGFAERMPASLRSLVLEDPESSRELADRVAAWARDRERLAPEIQKWATELRSHTWTDTAREIVEAIDAT